MSKPSDNYQWGDVLQTWDVGPYHIAKVDRIIDHLRTYDSALTAAQIANIYEDSDDIRETEYLGWVDGEPTGHIWESLDAALVGCIAYAHEGPNHHADQYFMRMIRRLPS